MKNQGIITGHNFRKITFTNLDNKTTTTNDSAFPELRPKMKLGARMSCLTEPQLPYLAADIPNDML